MQNEKLQSSLMSLHAQLPTGKIQEKMHNSSFPIMNLPQIIYSRDSCLYCSTGLYSGFIEKHLTLKCQLGCIYNFCNKECLEEYCLKNNIYFCLDCFSISYTDMKYLQILMPGYIRIKEEYDYFLLLNYKLDNPNIPHIIKLLNYKNDIYISKYHTFTKLFPVFMDEIKEEILAGRKEITDRWISLVRNLRCRC